VAITPQLSWLLNPRTIRQREQIRDINVLSVALVSRGKYVALRLMNMEGIASVL